MRFYCTSSVEIRLEASYNLGNDFNHFEMHCLGKSLMKQNVYITIIIIIQMVKILE